MRLKLADTGEFATGFPAKQQSLTRIAEISHKVVPKNSGSSLLFRAIPWHQLKGQKKETWSITVNGNWRVTFEFENGDAYIVNYEDYH
ncbi:MAG: type II toxin-antitoxin system RelE/ParE family toxin [Pseudomonadales bacterium]|nr:type II toxin-antitoxin system RelE/ParE family toxin [Pseudomonadales bacterium]